MKYHAAARRHGHVLKHRGFHVGPHIITTPLQRHGIGTGGVGCADGGAGIAHSPERTVLLAVVVVEQDPDFGP
ncbi:hypothetical protein V494_01637 [Pseudogymnoascus sp. VKM F-4513 (FW-928)]|nr:hypothetical protein V494_01637 [Pseudogymnoascus sp. VKM F-4513 (FW-928)]